MPTTTSETEISPTVLIPVTEEAARNNWRIVLSFESPPASGTFQHGYCAFERVGHGDDYYVMDGEDRAWGTAMWVRQEDGRVFFQGGRYDLLYEAAIKDALDRAGIDSELDRRLRK